MAAPLVVGFDLDLTLVDSRPGIAATYRALSARTGVFIDADAAATRLGPPLEVELALWFPVVEIEAVGNMYRQLYPEFAVDASPPLPGAGEAIRAVHDRGGRVVVITGKYESNAWLHLDHLGLTADAVVGWAWADGKVAAMVAHSAGVYVGDHPADMSATRAASAILDESRARGTEDHPRTVGGAVAAVGVTTGGHDAAELLAAGADVVLVDLTEFPRWLDSHLTTAPISVGLGRIDR